MFQRHLYYLRIPYAYGDPSFSWVMDPAKCNDPQGLGLLHALRKLNIKWVVKDPDYPAALRDSFPELERQKVLVPIASADLESLTGISRIHRNKHTTRVTIMELVD